MPIDNSVLLLVDKSLEELEYRADEIGKPLSNTSHSKLAGCREIKLRDAGLRIVYRITGQKVDILDVVYVLAIERRADGYVFVTAEKRYHPSKKIKTTKPQIQLGDSDVWKNKRN